VKFTYRKNQALAISPSALDQDFEGGAEPAETKSEKGIAIVSICGPLTHHENPFFDSYDCILERIECAMQDECVGAVVMCIDSPGGDANGTVSTHKRIRSLRSQYDKPIFAYSNEEMYSAAYAIGSSADEIWVPETGGVGSVGVICPLVDRMAANKKAGLRVKLITTGARKADSHEDRPMTDDVIASIQSRVDQIGQAFFKVVAKSRGMSVKAVEDLQAGVFLGQKAVESGLADGVSGWITFLNHVESQMDASSDAEVSVMKEKTSAQLKAAVASAAKAVAAAKSRVEHKKLFSAYEKAVLEQAQFASKMKYSKKTVEESEESDEEEEEEEEEEDEDEEEDDDKKDDDGDDDDDDDDDDDEEEEEDEEESESKKSKASSMSLKSVNRLVALAAKATGQRDLAKIFGALEGMGGRKAKLTATEKRLAKLEGERTRDRVNSLLTKAVEEGRIAPSQKESLREFGMKSLKELKGFLSQQPKNMIRTVKDGGLMHDPAKPGASVEQMSIDSMNADQMKVLSFAAQAAGKSLDDQLGAINKLGANGVKTPAKY
jgi:signal peptide peptidase SppA